MLTAFAHLSYSNDTVCCVFCLFVVIFDGFFCSLLVRWSVRVSGLVCFVPDVRMLLCFNLRIHFIYIFSCSVYLVCAVNYLLSEFFCSLLVRRSCVWFVMFLLLNIK